METILQRQSDCYHLRALLDPLSLSLSLSLCWRDNQFNRFWVHYERVLQWVSWMRWLFLSQFWPVLKQPSFLRRMSFSKNWLELKIVPPYVNLACPNRWNTLYISHTHAYYKCLCYLASYLNKLEIHYLISLDWKVLYKPVFLNRGTLKNQCRYSYCNLPFMYLLTIYNLSANKLFFNMLKKKKEKEKERLRTIA